VLKTPFAKSKWLITQRPTMIPSLTPTVSNDTSAATVYPIYTDCEEEWWQHTLLSESNTHGERL